MLADAVEAHGVAEAGDVELGEDLRTRVAETAGSIPRDVAAELVATLAWRGIRGFPKREDGPPAP